jgi:hypothetical protein
MCEIDVRNGYVEALLRANTYHYVDQGNGVKELESYDGAAREFWFGDFSREDGEDIEQFIADFLSANEDDFHAYRTAGFDSEQFGHDLLLTRSGHGAGFWDRGLGELGDRLTSAAKVYGDTSVEIIDGKPALVES